PESNTVKIGQRGRTCTCDRSVPGRVCWLLHYALMAPAGLRSRAGDLVSCGDGQLRSLERCPSEDWRSRREASEMQSVKCRVQSGEYRVLHSALSTLHLKMVGSAGNAPVRHFRLCFLTPDLQSGSRITSLAES